MKFHVLTLFPEMIRQGLGAGIIGRALNKGIISLDAVNIRDYTEDRHGSTDDYPYGGGAGMLMQAQPVYDAHRAVTGGRNVRTIYLTPQGIPFTQKLARELAGEDELIFLCGHYEGIDERVLEEVVSDRVSVGDYVLTGGELPAMVMIDAVARLIPGVLGNDCSAEEESFSGDLLEYPQYSRPEVWRGKKVPGVLLSGDHSKVREWRLKQSIARTAAVRPDLYERYLQKQKLIRRLSGEKRNNIHMMEALAAGQASILYAAEDGNFKGNWDILLYDEERRVCMMNAADAASGGKLTELVPEDAEQVVIYSDFLKEILEARGYGEFCRCRQMLYTRKETLPVKHKDIRPVSEETYAHAPDVYREAGIAYGPACGHIRQGDIYAAFCGDRPAGFIGLCGTGILQMLFVEESFRRQGIGASLEAYAVNRILQRGRTPYLYVPEGNEACERLQEKFGFYKSEKTFRWLTKGIAKKFPAPEKSSCK